jgi:hypothetical protein
MRNEAAGHGPGTVGRRALLIGGAGAAAAAVTTMGAPSAAWADAADCAVTRHDDAGAATLDEALAAVPEGGTLTVTRPWSRAAPLVVDRPVTIVFSGAGRLTMTADVAAIEVRAGGVTLRDVVLAGISGSRTGLGRGIVAAGTVEAPIDGLRVEGATITGFTHDGIFASFCRSFTIAGCTIGDVAYAGVMMLSCSYGVVRDCTIDGVNQPSPYVNSYGVIVSRDDTVPLAQAPRSSMILIDSNTVSGVASWEGIDTHAGEGIVVTGNTVRDCRVGIAMVPCKHEVDRGSTLWAPLDVVVSGNTVERVGLDVPGAGIVVKGAGDTVGSAAERATGVVVDNVVRGHGGGSEGGIVLYLTRDVIVSGNAFESCVGSALVLYHSNDAVMLLRNSATVLRPAYPGGAMAVVTVRSGANTGTISSTRFEAGGDAPARPVRGVAVGLAGNELDLLGNDWSQTDLAVWGSKSVVNRYGDGA